MNNTNKVTLWPSNLFAFLFIIILNVLGLINSQYKATQSINLDKGHILTEEPFS